MLGTLKVTYEDGTTVEGVTKNADAIRFERQFGMPASRMFGKNSTGEMELYLEHLWFYGWCVAKRDGETQPFDEWADRVVSVEVAEATKPNPTRPSRSRSQ